MKAKVLKIKEISSRYGGICYAIFFKTDGGRSLRTWVAQNYGNFKRWWPVIDSFFKSSGEIWLDGLSLKGDRLVDADSLFTIV
jgi:hypothetical protein